VTRTINLISFCFILLFILLSTYVDYPTISHLRNEGIDKEPHNVKIDNNIPDIIG
jgi:hypothetical protein